MAVQIPDPGTGNGQTGDNEYVFRKKVKDNFSDQTNAASKLVGPAAGQIPLAQQTFKAAFKNTDSAADFTDYNSLEVGSRVFVGASGKLNEPPAILGDGIWVVETLGNHPSVDTRRSQVATNYTTGAVVVRALTTTWTAWQPIANNIGIYNQTTALGANVVVDATGKLMRSTSSERYKDILAPLELDDARYDDAMSLKPIVYRSTAEADNPAYHYYSFSAEELGAYDPAFTLWRETETVTDADGNVTEQPLAERQAEGININALLAMSHAIAIKQDKIIKALERRLDILEAK